MVNSTSAHAPCSSCAIDACPARGRALNACPEDLPRPYQGGRFAAACALTFLLPLVLAVALGTLAATPSLRALGALGGLASGMFLSRLLLRLLPTNTQPSC